MAPALLRPLLDLLLLLLNSPLLGLLLPAKKLLIYPDRGLLDRLSRNAAFIFTLKTSGVDFVCADMPEANTFTIGIFAVLALNKRELISSRLRAVLQAQEAREARPGKPENFTSDEPPARTK